MSEKNGSKKNDPLRDRILGGDFDKLSAEQRESVLYREGLALLPFAQVLELMAEDLADEDERRRVLHELKMRQVERDADRSQELRKRERLAELEHLADMAGWMLKELKRVGWYDRIMTFGEPLYSGPRIFSDLAKSLTFTANTLERLEDLR